MNGVANGTRILQDPNVAGANDPWAGTANNGMPANRMNPPQGQGGMPQGQGGMPPASDMPQSQGAMPQPQNTMPQAQGAMQQPLETMVQETTVSGSEMRHGLSEDVIGSPISVEEAYLGSMRGMLGRQIGAYIAATFLMGNNEMVRWEGRLYEVGNNYMIIYQQPQGRYVVGDLNSLRFVEFIEEGRIMDSRLWTCNNGPTSW